MAVAGKRQDRPPQRVNSASASATARPRLVNIGQATMAVAGNRQDRPRRLTAAQRVPLPARGSRSLRIFSARSSSSASTAFTLFAASVLMEPL